MPGCGGGRPTYESAGKVIVIGAVTFAPVSDTDKSHYWNPPVVSPCDIAVEKTCMIMKPPVVGGIGECLIPIDVLTLEYSAAATEG